MTISLTLPERIGVIILLAEVNVGKRSFLNFIKDGRDAVEIKKEEIQEYGITGRQGGGLDWNKETADIAKEFTLSEGVSEFITKRLKELEDALPMDLLPLANKILGEAEKNG